VQPISSIDNHSKLKRPQGEAPDPQRVSREVESITSVHPTNMTIGQAVCREYRIASGFVWPPVPSYRFDNNLLGIRRPAFNRIGSKRLMSVRENSSDR